MRRKEESERAVCARESKARDGYALHGQVLTNRTNVCGSSGGRRERAGERMPAFFWCCRRCSALSNGRLCQSRSPFLLAAPLLALLALCSPLLLPLRPPLLLLLALLLLLLLLLSGAVATIAPLLLVVKTRRRRRRRKRSETDNDELLAGGGGGRKGHLIERDTTHDSGLPYLKSRYSPRLKAIVSIESSIVPHYQHIESTPRIVPIASSHHHLSFISNKLLPISIVSLSPSPLLTLNYCPFLSFYILHSLGLGAQSATTTRHYSQVRFSFLHECCQNTTKPDQTHVDQFKLPITTKTNPNLASNQ